MHRTGRAVETIVVLVVLHVLVLLSLQSAGVRVAATLERAERAQAELDAAALAQERAVNDLLGEQVVVAQVSGGLPETPAVRAGRAFVAATSHRLPEGVVPGAVVLLAAGLAVRHAVRRRERRRRQVRAATVLLSAFSPAAARCAPADPRGTVVLPVR